MTSPWGSFPRIKFGDQFMLIPAGRSGVDFKIVIKTPEPGYHYTVSVAYPSVSNPWQLPIYAEKTLETTPKAHNIIGRGSVNLQKMVESVVPAAFPVVSKVNPETFSHSGEEFIVFTPETIRGFGKGEITLDEQTLGLFQPVSYNDLMSNSFAIGMPIGVTGSGILLHTTAADYSMTFPSFDTIEEKIERAATLRKVDEYIEARDEDTEDYY